MGVSGRLQKQNQIDWLQNPPRKRNVQDNLGQWKWKKKKKKKNNMISNIFGILPADSVQAHGIWQ